MTNDSKNSGLTKIGDIIQPFEKEKNKYITREFQQYGAELAEELGDSKHISLYIKLAKEKPRAHLESARSFVKDAANVKSKPKLFMWKLAQLKSKEKEN